MDDKRLISKTESKIESFCWNNGTKERYELNILEQSAKLNPCESCFLSNVEIKSRPQYFSNFASQNVRQVIFFYTYL